MRWHFLSPQLCFSALLLTVRAQTDTLGLQDGYISLSTANFDLKLVNDAQVLASLTPAGSSFDFLPFDYLPLRADNGQYHNGDITFRYRSTGAQAWIDADSSQARQPVTAITNSSGSPLAAADLTPTLPSDSPIQVTRQWLDVDGDLGLSFNIINQGSTSLEIGSLGLPTEFNSIFTNRTSEEMQAVCSLIDPYIGLDAGYLQVTPVSGTGDALIVTPLGNTKTPLEAWRNLNEPGAYDAYGSQVFEGFYEWQIYSLAYAENEWANATPWNTATSTVLQPGESTTVGLRFSVVSSGVRGIQKAVQTTGTPLTIGASYVVPVDLTAKLFIFYTASVSSVVADNNAFNIVHQSNFLQLTPTGAVQGRTKITINYSDGKTQTVHYFITASAQDVLTRLGNFTTSEMWFDDSSDPFGRAPSVMTWDDSVQAIVDQEQRVWISGLSDEGGTVHLASTMKQFAQADSTEVAKLEQFATQVLSTTIQNADDFTVRKSIFYYDPAALPNYKYSSSIYWGNWWSWNKAAAYSTDRAYDYIHVLGSYWALYRVGRDNPALFPNFDWEWYLANAYNTTITCFATDSNGNGLVPYSRLGLMGETVVGELLVDLQREGWTDEAVRVEAAMKLRADAWDAEAVPFGSEMSWDSTGQEGVYYWTNFFNLESTATKAVNTILGYMPTVSHWGWNGNARRYWDFIYAGKLQRIERMLHHYGSSLNALPLLAQFRQTPSDTYLLRVAYGGITGPLSNVRADGSMYNAFHSFPDTLVGDAYSGDYGQNFLGLMLGSGTYVVNDPDVGLIAYGGNLAVLGNIVKVNPRDPVRRRFYVAAMGVYITISTGQIDQFAFSNNGEPTSVQLRIVPGVSEATEVIVWVETPGTTDSYAVTTAGGQSLRGGAHFSLPSNGLQVTVAKSN